MKVKESDLYLSFFCTNFKQIILPATFLMIAFTVLGLLQPVQLHDNVLMQINGTDPGNRQILADQAVAEIRAANIIKGLGLDNKTKVVVYKSGPYLLNIDTTNKNGSLAQEDLRKSADYLMKNFSAGIVSKEISYSQRPPVWLFTLVGFACGSILGIVFRAAKFYLQNY